MGKVVDQLAELTGYKDRDVMDVTLVVALRDMLSPLSVSIYRAVGQNPAYGSRYIAALQTGLPQLHFLCKKIHAKKKGLSKVADVLARTVILTLPPAEPGMITSCRLFHSGKRGKVQTLRTDTGAHPEQAHIYQAEHALGCCSRTDGRVS